MTHPFLNAHVAAVFEGFSPEDKATALALRALIFEVAQDTPEAGAIEETLKWGQPSYLTAQTKAGSTLRIGQAKGGGVAIFAHCGTSIIRSYAEAFPDADEIEGNRAVIFKSRADIAPDRLRHLIRHGLTYHLPAR
ncbi:MAG: DUF1801 domain-containing protein [Yoonia sp.]|uniref:DUF1801 domain-containing protein n=1 Tax=Yoonia sp. TaxID=2212373 RepID=UPI00273D81EF|nr:DUF1801 domain-containing protein [Yoonia sp.]MDP5084960.1 DUF1801 domain-containing protein [Yoonia sp.]MDP5362622.1 DUF1801 domain-containing protein [Paracoccaceae bacterium]